MPLTPDANLAVVRFFEPNANRAAALNVLDEFFGLDVAHAMDTSNTITVDEI